MRRRTERFVLWLMVVLAGCTPRQQVEQRTFEKSDSEYVIAVIVDMSGSFSGKMANDGVAYRFCLGLIDRYFKDRIATNDRLVISQISSNTQALLFEGRPLDLRKQFPTPAKFREFLADGNSGGSPIHDAITQTVRYLLDDEAVASGRAKTALFVLSDMDDTSGVTVTQVGGKVQYTETPNDSEERAVEVLTEFGQANGIVGLYYVGPGFISRWNDNLRKASVKDFRVQSSIVARPQLPSFEN